MRTFEIRYTIRGQVKLESFKAYSNTLAVNKLLRKFTPRERLFFKFVSISMI